MSLPTSKNLPRPRRWSFWILGGAAASGLALYALFGGRVGLKAFAAGTAVFFAVHVVEAVRYGSIMTRSGEHGRDDSPGRFQLYVMLYSLLAALYVFLAFYF